MVHMFERAGLHIALDTGSGAVHVLDDITKMVLQAASGEELKAAAANEKLIGALKGRYEAGTIEDTIGEIQALINEGLLFSSDDYGEFAAQLAPAPVKAMCLHIAHDCNLRCKYCFASTGGFGGERMLMPFDIAKAAVDLLIELSEKRRNLEVDFFGGEPLMNFEVVQKTVDYARTLEKPCGKNFRFTLTTNGLGLSDDRIEYINSVMGNVVLSLDGRRQVNDQMRPMVDGSGSYDRIVPKMQRLVAGRQGKEYYVRGTYTRHNLDFDKDVLALYGLGFNQISVEPVVGHETDEYAIRASDVAEIEASYVRLMDEMAGRSKKGRGRFNFFHFMLDLDNGPCAIKRLKGCGSGNEYIAVTPDGDIYPCHQFVGNPAFKMGTVDEGLVRTDIKEEFANAHLLNKHKCQGCWAKLFCSGGCNANNYTYAGSILEPHTLSCELEKIRLECAITLKALELMGDAG